MKKKLFYLFSVAIICFSCSDNSEIESPIVDNQEMEEFDDMAPRVKFESTDQLQMFLDEVNEGRVSNLKSENISKKLKSYNVTLKSGRTGSDGNRSSGGRGQFVSLLDAIRNRDLATLTREQLAEVKADPDDLVYVPDDSIIADPAFAAVLNCDREIQVGSTVYKYAEDGIYTTSEANAHLLSRVGRSSSGTDGSSGRSSSGSTSSGGRSSGRTGDNIDPKSDSRITYYRTSRSSDGYSSSSRGTIGSRESYNGGAANTGTLSPSDYLRMSTYSTMNSGTPGSALTLEDGVVIKPDKIRDLNYNDRGDGNWLHNAWTSLWGKNIVAINKYSKDRKMLVTFYDQDYLIYKNIGTQAKMQKKKFWIWWNTSAQEIRLGWTAIELEEKYTAPPYTGIPKPNIQFPQHPNLNSWELSTPAWLSKNFPFRNNYTLFTIPIVKYDLGTKDLNKAYYAAIKEVESKIKSYMNAHNKKNTPKDIGIAALTNSTTMRYIIGPSEEKETNSKSMQKKFMSEWFGGEYEIGYSMDPNNPKASISKFKFKIAGNKTKLKRGCVYAAVKYNGEWRAARIIKTE